MSTATFATVSPPQSSQFPDKLSARRSEIKDRLISCAYKTVSEHGFGALTIGQLARDVGIATGAVYRYFDTKAQLCATLFRIASEKELAVIRDIATGEGSPRKRLLESVGMFAHRAILGQRLAYALIAEPVDPIIDEERLCYRREYAAIFEALITQGVAAQEFPPQAAAVSAAAVVGVIAETLVGPLASKNPEPLLSEEDRLIKAIQAFCLRAVASREHFPEL